MKAWSSYSLIITGVFVLAGSVCATTGHQGKEVYNYPLKQAPAKIRVEGSSNLGEWDCSQNAINGMAEVNVSIKNLRLKIADLLNGHSSGSAQGLGWEAFESQVRVAIDANGFDCDNGRMQRDLAEAIRAEKYPSINYWFSSVEAISVGTDDEKGPYLQLKVRGELLFGGRRRETVHTSRLWLSDDSVIEVKGSLDLEMSEFGIKPPTAFFGLIRAENRFQVGYHIKLETNELVSVEPSSPQLYSSADIRN